MRSRRAPAIYRRLLRCYPRQFRDDYGADMELIFAHQLDDEPALRVWARTAADFATTMPARQLEAHMKHARDAFVPMLFAGISIAGVVAMLVTGGSGPSTPIKPLVTVGLVGVTGVAAVLAIVSRRPIRALTPNRSITAQWWKFLATGVGLLLTAIVVEGATDISAWYLLIVTVLFSILAIGAGVILGIAHLSRPLWSRRPAV